MSLKDRRQQAENERQTNDGDYRLYMTAIEAFANGDIETAHRNAKWLVSDQGGNQGDTPEAVLLLAMTSSRLPSTHPEYSPSLSYSDTRKLYEQRDHLGNFHKSACGYAGVNVALPMGTAAWSQFQMTWPVMTKEAITAAYVLTAANATTDYQTINEALEEYLVRPQHPLTFVAAMELYFVTQRWDLLTNIVERARSAGFPAAGGGTAVDSPLHDSAAACGAMAHASLGEMEQAKPLAQAASESDFVAVAAYGYYLQAMIARADERVSESQKLLAESLKIRHTLQASQALNDESFRLRTTLRSTIGLRTDPWSVETEPDPEMERRAKQKEVREGYRARAEALLAQQIGMEGVKAQLRRITQSMRVEEERRRRIGTGAPPSNYNLVLMGAPGTGKSTIVEALALHMAAEGVVENPDVLTLTKADLVSGYVGQTSGKVKEALARGKGRVIFIDEAYALVQDVQGGNSEAHGQDAIDEIVSEAETLIGVSVLVMAGYEKDMKRLLQTNEGLESRFPRRIIFDSFTLEQFAEVVKVQAQRMGLSLAPEAEAFLLDEHGEARRMFNTAPSGRPVIDVLGNGRLARNVADRAREELSVRLAEVDLSQCSDAELSTLTEHDVATALRVYVEAGLMGGSTS